MHVITGGPRPRSYAVSACVMLFTQLQTTVKTSINSNSKRYHGCSFLQGVKIILAAAIMLPEDVSSFRQYEVYADIRGVSWKKWVE